MAGRFSVEAVFKAIDKVTAPVKKMQKQVNKFTRNMRLNFGRLSRVVDKVGGAMKKAGKLAASGAAIAGLALGDVIRTGARFEQTLVNAAAKFPDDVRKGTVAFEELQAAALQVGSTTEFTASQSAEALNFLALAGFTSKQAIAALPGVVDLATAAQVDLATATDIATDTLGAFNFASKTTAELQANLSRVSDILAKASTSANFTIEQMFETMKEAGPIGTAAGQSIETVATLAGTLANAGIKGTRAGTGLKNIFTALNAPASKAGKVLRALGIETAGTDGKIRNAIDVFEDFRKATAELPQQQQMKVFDTIFGKIPLAAAINLTKAGGKMRAFEKTLKGAINASKEMAATMRDTLQGRLNSLSSAIEGVKLRVFALSSGPINDLVERMTDWVRVNGEVVASKLAEFIIQLLDNLPKIVAWIKKIAIGISIFLAFSAVIKTVAGVLTILNLLMLANPITLITLGIIAAIAAFTALVIWIDEVSSGFEKMPRFIKLALAPLKLFIEGIRLAKNLLSGEGIGESFEKFGKGIAGIFTPGGSAEGAETTAGSVGAGVASPQERIAKTIQESRTTTQSEITIRDETGRAQNTGGDLPAGVQVMSTGAF